MSGWKIAIAGILKYFVKYVLLHWKGHMISLAFVMQKQIFLVRHLETRPVTADSLS